MRCSSAFGRLRTPDRIGFQPKGGRKSRKAGAMRLALSVGYWGMGIDADGQLTMALEAERLGYDSVWVAEAYGSDAATVLAWLAAQTSTIGLGSAVFQIPARSPAMAAMTAATLDRLSGGRFRLGLGVSGPQVAEGWHGQRYARPLERTRDYVAVVRKALARERGAYRGETLELPLHGGQGKALKLTVTPVQRPLPIYLAAMGPRNLALAGEIADGCLGFLFDPAHGGEVRAALQEGAARGDRKSTRLNSSHVEISYAVFCLKKKKTTCSHIVDGKRQKVTFR